MMKLEEVTMLLHLMNSLDGRCQINKVKISSWAELLREKADALSFADARQIVIDHYSEGAEMLTPDVFVATHRRLKKIKESLSRSETASQPARVPMPEWFKAAVYDMQRPQAGNDGDPMSIGQIFASAAHFAKTETAADPLDRHCFGSSCSCLHESCYRGWLDSETETSPCRQCRPGLALVLDEIAPLGSRNPHDQQLLESIEHRRELLGWSGIR
jgi:hypothetical protein